MFIRRLKRLIARHLLFLPSGSIFMAMFVGLVIMLIALQLWVAPESVPFSIPNK